LTKGHTLNELVFTIAHKKNIYLPPSKKKDAPQNILENVEHCGGEPEQADTGI